MSDIYQNSENNKRNGNGNKNGFLNESSTPFFSFFGQKDSQDPDEVELKKLVYTIWRNKWVLISFVIVGLLFSYTYIEFATPVYKSEGTILISSPDKRINNGDSGLAEIIANTYGVGVASTLANELEVLHSRMFAGEIAKKLIEGKSDSERKRFPLLWIEKDENYHSADVETVASRIGENIKFERSERESDVITISYESSSPEEAEIVVNIALDTYSNISTKQHRQAAVSAVTFLDKEQEQIEQKLEETEARLREFMNQTGIVEVDEQASRMIERMATLESELQKTTINLEVIESGIETYRKRIDNIRPGLTRQFSNAILPKMESYQNELAKLETERMMMISTNPGIREKDPIPPQLVKLDNEIEILQSEINQLSEELFGSEEQFIGFMNTRNSNNGSTQSELQELYNKMVELEIQRAQDTALRNILSEERNKLNSQFYSLPDNMIDLARLQRDVKINEELFLTVSKQNAEMSLWQETQFGLGRIIDTGYIPGIPIKPKKIQIYIIGFILSGVAGFGFIFILFVRGNMDNRIHSVEQIKNSYFPLLSTIPVINTSKKKSKPFEFKVGSGPVPGELITVTNSSSLESEAFRRLKNNIIYLNPDKRVKSVAVTSPEKGDGKTTIAANLGVTYAEAGYKTVIVDTDFHRPNIHNKFGIQKSPGITDYLFGELSRFGLFKKTDIENLFIVTAGKEVPNNDLISESKAFHNLLLELEESFDMVILDTSPFGIISDSTALLSRVNGTLLAVRYSKTNLAMFEQCLESLYRIHAQIIGTVLNDFNHKKETGYYYNSEYYKSYYSNYNSYVKKN